MLQLFIKQGANEDRLEPWHGPVPLKLGGSYRKPKLCARAPPMIPKQILYTLHTGPSGPDNPPTQFNPATKAAFGC
jgi:hypothetical protein